MQRAHRRLGGAQLQGSDGYPGFAFGMQCDRHGLGWSVRGPGNWSSSQNRGRIGAQAGNLNQSPQGGLWVGRAPSPLRLLAVFAAFLRLGLSLAEASRWKRATWKSARPRPRRDATCLRLQARPAISRIKKDPQSGSKQGRPPEKAASPRACVPARSCYIQPHDQTGGRFGADNGCISGTWLRFGPR